MKISIRVGSGAKQRNAETSGPDVRWAINDGPGSVPFVGFHRTYVVLLGCAHSAHRAYY